eukprot:9334241-Alexandrium_andersonii.AAC.1
MVQQATLEYEEQVKDGERGDRPPGAEMADMSSFYGAIDSKLEELAKLKQEQLERSAKAVEAASAKGMLAPNQVQ